MRRIAPLLLCALLAGPVFGAGDVFAGPDPAKLKAASESFEAGARAFGANRFEEAAQHFEAADAAAPSAKALRLAIKARKNAGQNARAASLAALALDRYGNDDETKKLAKETLDEVAPKLHKVEVSCASLCLLATGNKIVHGEAAPRWTLYLDPGKTTIGASFLGKIAAPDQTVNAVAGGSSKIRFVPPHDAVGTGGAGGEAPAGGSGGAGGATGGGGEGGGGAPPIVEPDPEEPKSDWRIHPAFFFVGLGVTAGLGGAAIWSGIDTINNPGVDAVRAECQGQGEDCPLYQEGQKKEVRTNALIGATAGVAVVTVILGAVGKWSGDGAKEDEAESTAVTFDVPRLWVDVGSANERKTSVHLELGGRF